MRFNIFRNETNNFYFSVPTNEAIEKAEKAVALLCRNQCAKSYPAMREPAEQLEMELKKMKETGTAFHFLILREAARLSHEERYPVMANSKWACSLIAFLLGITTVDPFNTFNSGRYALGKPSFEIFVASPVFDKLRGRLMKKFGKVEADDSAYKCINFMESKRCERIGEVAIATGQTPVAFGNDIYISVLQTISEEIVSHSLEIKDRDEEEYLNLVKFASEIKEITECDFDTLVRIYAYNMGTFTEPKCLENLKAPNFFVLREELVSALLSCGMSYSDAEYLAHKGVWHNMGNRPMREKDAELMKKYNVPQEIRDNFSTILHLQPAYGCLNRIELLCMETWYKINYPEEYEKTYDESGSMPL